MVLLLSFAACNRNSGKDEIVIGFSQCTGGPWRESMLADMKRELSFHPKGRLLYRQADGNTNLQIDQVKELIQADIDLLIVSPNEAEPLTPVVDEAVKKGIPVIVVDRKISAPIYTAYVGGDNYGVGKMAGEYTANLLKGKGTLLEFTLLPGSSPASERSRGFADAINQHPSLHLATEVNGEWLKDTINKQVDSIVTSHPDIDLVFAQNDFLATRVASLYQRLGLPKPKIIGADGLPYKGEGMDLVANNIITATLLYPTGGEEAIRTAFQILAKKNFQRENVIQTTVIDSTNVRYMQLQASKMGNQQAAIERQQSLLTDLKTLTDNQRTFLIILIVSLLLALLSGGVVFYFLRVNRNINRQLQVQNNEILEQKKELEVMSAKAQAANEAKVNFFTNISHEFRTPLTLILAPLEEMQNDARLNQRWSQNLKLVHKNVIRLLRLVNQLMDFRKVEVEKMQLKASENDLVFFTTEILQSYQSIAQKRNIDLRLMTNERTLPVWFDVNMLDKVLFNLLSNAFKFTRDGGFIHVYLNRSADGKAVVIKVEDNGVGMEKEAVNNLFSVFYQGEFENQKGSGLGLALSKELIQLHRGAIAVNSEKGKGTTFTIHLPLGKEHLKEEECTVPSDAPFVFYEDEMVYTTDLLPESSRQEIAGLKQEKEHTILIIEDNEDLRNFLKRRLERVYEIAEAENGNTAMQQAFDVVPDLIVSDVVIPEKDGVTLTNIFKSDIRTSHIPIVMLTGKTNIESQIEGMRARADAYITKPFNTEFLEQTIHSLLANRATLKEHFTAELPSSLKTQTVGKIDRKFVSEFTALVEHNLANENFTVDDICKELGISRVQLYRKVKALMNISVNDYVLNMRLQKAKYLLQHEDLNIAEVSYQVGFSSPAYFSTVFKSKFGVTPKAFRAK